MTHPLVGRDPPSERGSASVVAAGLMVAIVVLALAASDVAQVFAAASRAQTAADSAALAAAQAIVIRSDGVSPEASAADYAERNGAELVSCSCAGDGDDAVVEVRVPVGRLFLFGNDRTVTARARAAIDPRPPPT